MINIITKFIKITENGFIYIIISDLNNSTFKIDILNFS